MFGRFLPDIEDLATDEKASWVRGGDDSSKVVSLESPVGRAFSFTILSRLILTAFLCRGGGKMSAEITIESRVRESTPSGGRRSAV